MRFFALETNIGKIKAPFLHADERELLLVRHHLLQFFFTPELYFTLLGYFAVLFVTFNPWYPLPPDIATIVAAAAFITSWYLVFWIYASFRYDFIFFTIDKMVIVNSGLFHQSINPINLDNVTAVSSETQYWNIFPFGVLRIKVRDEAKTAPAEGMSVTEPAQQSNGQSDIIYRYTPDSPAVAAKVNEIITDFVRRKMNIAAPLLPESSSAQLRQVAQRNIHEKRAEDAVNAVLPPSANGEKEQEERQKKLAKDEDAQRRRMLNNWGQR